MELFSVYCSVMKNYTGLLYIIQLCIVDRYVSIYINTYNDNYTDENKFLQELNGEQVITLPLWAKTAQSV